MTPTPSKTEALEAQIERAINRCNPNGGAVTVSIPALRLLLEQFSDETLRAFVEAAVEPVAWTNAVQMEAMNEGGFGAIWNEKLSHDLPSADETGVFKSFPLYTHPANPSPDKTGDSNEA